VRDRAKLALGFGLPHLCRVQLTGFQPYPIRRRVFQGREELFDPVRRKFVAHTPEEWVRQHLICFFNLELGYSLATMAVEHSLKVYGLRRRADVLVFKRGEPRLLAECKAPAVRLSEAVFDQADAYNTHMGLHWIVLTNGLEHLLARREQSWNRASCFPTFDQL